MRTCSLGFDLAVVIVVVVSVLVVIAPPVAFWKPWTVKSIASFFVSVCVCLCVRVFVCWPVKEFCSRDLLV